MEGRAALYEPLACLIDFSVHNNRTFAGGWKIKVGEAQVFSRR